MIEQINAVFLKDGYKVDHRSQFVSGTEYIYNNFCPRSKRNGNNDEEVLFIGTQYLILEYIIDRWNKTFFNRPKEKVLRQYKDLIDSYIGKDKITLNHIAQLHDMQYLPLLIKALPEGSFVPHGVPVMTCVNTHPDFAWLSQMLETLISCVLWKISTSATTAYQFRLRLEQHALKTGYDPSFVKWQGHDFSFRGDSFTEDAIVNGFALLCVFTGSDTIPSIEFAKLFYQADYTKELVAGTVPATEHSVMSIGIAHEGEFETLKRLITETYPTGPVSIVCDTEDFWKVITEYLPRLKDEIMNRDGRVIIRPDSGDPIRIICGYHEGEFWNKELTEAETKGAWQCLYEIFGGTMSNTGYKLLDTHIGLIYGDAINLDREDVILHLLEKKGFAFNNGVFGMGSYLYQFTTRDVHCWAIKATWSQVDEEPVELSKNPKTDSGFKKSLKGLLKVYKENGKFKVQDQCILNEECQGLLEIVYESGVLFKTTTLNEIRTRVDKHIQTQLLDNK
jgi:nicotinamide phosphoribosyltransferase